MPANHFTNISLSGWRQFDDVEIDLDNRLSVITGANASGKTTILNLLSRHFDWNTPFLASPARSGGGFLVGFRRWLNRYRNEVQGGQVEIGRIGYGNGSAATLSIPEKVGSIQYEVSIAGREVVAGLYLSSHRTLSDYQPVENIPARFTEHQSMFDQYIREIRQRTQGSGFLQKSPMLVMKESLLASAVFGEGNSAVRPNAEAAEIWTGFERVLARLFPKSLGFQRLVAQPPELMLQTTTGEFTIDSLSGGLTAIVELSWQIFLRSQGQSDFTVCVDEPENHLHPSLQRTVLPSLLDAFPSARFVIATHSPFVVTSSSSAAVHVLRYKESSVYSEQLDFGNKAAAADETLRNVLGLETTLPVWAEERFNEIINRYLTVQNFHPGLLINLRNELREAGLNEELPVALDNVRSQISGGRSEAT